MGPNFELGVTVSSPELGGDINRTLLNGGFSAAWRSANWMFTGNTWLTGRLDEGDARNWVVGVQATASQLGTRGWQFRILAEGSHELDLDRDPTEFFGDEEERLLPQVLMLHQVIDERLRKRDGRSA